jgi:hypothetical protein
MAQDFDALDEALDEGTNGSSDSDDDYDNVEQLPYLKAVPRVAVAGNLVDASLMGSIKATQNIQVDNGMGSDIAFDLADPEVYLGELWESTQRDGGLVRNNDDAMRPDDKRENVDYRLAGTGDDTPRSSLFEEGDDGEPTETGIELYSNGYRSELVDEFTDDTVRLFLGGQSGRLIAQGVDAFGAESAYYDDDGDPSRGMVEYHPDHGEDGMPNPRIARTPEVHPELVDERVIIYLRFGDEYNGNKKKLGHVFLDDADEITDCTELTGNSLDVYDEPDTDVYNPWMVWHDGDYDGDDGGDDGGGSTGSTETTADTTDFDLGSDDDTQGTEYGDLSAPQKQFVDTLVGEADGMTVDEAFGSFDAIVEKNIEAGNIARIDPDTIRAVVNSRT